MPRCTIVEMKYGLDITSAGDWGRPDQIAGLAALAEDHGWDGVFCEDYLAFPGGLPTYDVWVTLGLVAQATMRMTIGTMVTPLPCRHVPTVLLQARSLAALSGGRFALGVGSGDPEATPSSAGPGGRGERSSMPRWPRSARRHPTCRSGSAVRPRCRRRGPARCVGTARLYRVPPPAWEDLTPDDVADLRAAAGRSSYVILVGGRERRDDLAADRHYVSSVADAGADWWQEYVPPRLTLDEARRRIRAGPIGA